MASPDLNVVYSRRGKNEIICGNLNRYLADNRFVSGPSPVDVERALMMLQSLSKRTFIC